MLSEAELGRYAEEYRVIEACLPSVLSSIVDALPDGPARRLVQENIEDEMSRPAPHLALFEDFADSVGARKVVAPTNATITVVTCQRDAARRSPAAGLAALASYEVQAAEVAATKAEGLRDHYRTDRAGRRFWDVHAQMESHHAEWTTMALSALSDDESELVTAASSAAQAWWEFLSDRESERESLTP